jgi:hypothetical protein
MSDRKLPTGWPFDETRERQILLGLELTPAERLDWLDARRYELARLRALMPPHKEPDADGN